MTDNPTPVSPRVRVRLGKFVVRIYWSFGLAALTWSAVAVVAVARRASIEMPVWGAAATSEIALVSLIGLPLMMIPVILALQIYREHILTGADPKDPGSWMATLPGGPTIPELPRPYRWLKLVILVIMVIAPMATLTHCWFRMSARYSIVWIDEVNKDPKGEPWEHQQSGWRKYLPPAAMPEHAKTWFSGGWRWRGDKEEWNALQQFSPPAIPGGSPQVLKDGYTRVAPSAWPVIMPWLATTVTFGLWGWVGWTLRRPVLKGKLSKEEPEAGTAGILPRGTEAGPSGADSK